jgi:hypothetical protein
VKTKSVQQKVRIGASIITALAMGSAFPALADTIASLPSRAAARFQPIGDVFYVVGRGAYVDWRIPSTGRSDRCYASSSPCNYNFRERRSIEWKLCAPGSPPCTPRITDNTSRP